MKIALATIVFIGILLFLFFRFNKSNKASNKTKTINLNELTPSPIQHKTLSETQLEQIKSIHKTFEEVYPVTLEETITNFKRDRNIDNEIQLWMKMKETFLSVMEQKQYSKIEERKEVFKLILMRSMMSNADVIKNAKVKELDNESIASILNLFESKMTE